MTPFVRRLAVAVCVVLASTASAQVGSLKDAPVEAKGAPAKPYSPYAGRSYPTRPFFGDTHLHTIASMDAGMFGTRLTVADAYRFARGEEITSSSGQRVKLSRPLDFLVVTDHSDNLGFFTDFLAGKPELLAVPTGRRWYDMMMAGESSKVTSELIVAFNEQSVPKELIYFPGSKNFRDAWAQYTAASEQYNAPGRFTAFIGYEWTSAPGGNNVHRNVIYRDGADKARQVDPFTTMPPFGSLDPVDLWKWMDGYEKKTGGSVLAIAHNGNLSNGTMFPVTEAFGKKVDKEYATTRARWEPIYEMTQMKGTGEAHPFLSATDEFADFEIWDRANLSVIQKKKEMLEFEYARSALKNGLLLEKQLGVNPYKFGMVGSSDSHTGLATVEEENFFNKSASAEPSPDRMKKVFIENPKSGLKFMDWEVGASGYAAVWAAENTRESIFDAMQRRETYATTGSRLVVRFFGGWDFETKDAGERMVGAVGYAKGVPMGGDLRKAPKGKAPAFLVAAMKDPYGGNLDRIQVVKGWMDAKGQLQEKVYDVAWAGDRKPDPKTGKVPSVGSTVDVDNATFTNTIGAPELIAVWKDPAFDASQRAFYYARVIEIPTPRWTAYDAKRYGVKPPPGTWMTVTERGYTSPIWYTP